MNRRSLFKALIAAPIAAALAPLVPKWTEAMRDEYEYQIADRLAVLNAERVKAMSSLLFSRPALISQRTAFDVLGFTHKEDISELLFRSFKDVPPDTVYLLDTERMVPPERFLWQEDSLTLLHRPEVV